MRYRKATEILPEELVEAIQKYMDGGYVYIPRKEENKKKWGEETLLSERTQDPQRREIYRRYLDGFGVKTLAEEYFLSEKSIQRIILSEKIK